MANKGEHLHAIDASLDSESRIVHVASNVAQNLLSSLVQTHQKRTIKSEQIKSEQSWLRRLLTLAFNPILQMAAQSSLDCAEAAGEVSSIWTVS
jgi:hypothetical protein